MINGIQYLLPLTSQTTTERKKRGKKKRSNMVTTFVRDTSGTEIANILHNNMIPVFQTVITMLNIDASVDTYESNEIRYIRKNSQSIIDKAKSIHDKRLTNNDGFLNNVCCDFQLLENNFRNYTPGK